MRQPTFGKNHLGDRNEHQPDLVHTLDINMSSLMVNLMLLKRRLGEIKKNPAVSFFAKNINYFIR